VGRFQQVTGAFGLAACFACCGCMHGFIENSSKKAAAARQPEAAADAIAGGPPPEAKTDANVKQAAATVPAAAPAALANLGKLAAVDKHKGGVAEFALTWQPKIAYLPDPTNNGAMGAGVVGQVFMYGPGYKPAQANGKLVVEMFDETVRSGSGEPSHARLGTWTFDKESLRLSMTMDERFGKCYVIFLRWPDYKPEYTKLKLTARFDPDKGYPLYAPTSMLTLDQSNGEPATITRSQTIVTGSAASGATIPGGFMGPPAGAAAAAPAAFPPLNPVPVGGRNAATGLSNPALPLNLAPSGIPSGGR
jgi:hypothetical protein